MSRIFINYRRSDSAAYAGRLTDALKARYSQEHVIHDASFIRAGENYSKAVARMVEECDVFLVLIGPHWLNVLNDNGMRQLENPDDIVRMELARALSYDKPVIPILVGGASMPMSADLPSELQAFSYRQAFELKDITWQDDLLILFRVLDGFFPVGNSGPTAPSPAKAHNVFVSYAKEDKAFVKKVVAALEETEGLRCWVSYRDIPPGATAWSGDIFDAITKSRLVVIVLTSHAMGSNHVLREITIADEENIPFIGFCLDDVPLSGKFRYFFSTSQRLDAAGLPQQEAVALLKASVTNFMSRTT